MRLTSPVPLILVAAVVLFGLAFHGFAHQTSSGWTYPPACCKGYDVGGDCERIPDTDVTKGPLGFSVLLHPGDHHLVTRSQLFLISYGDEIPSGDGHFHICLHPTEDHVNCFFAPRESV